MEGQAGPHRHEAPSTARMFVLFFVNGLSDAFVYPPIGPRTTNLDTNSLVEWDGLGLAPPLVCECVRVR